MSLSFDGNTSVIWTPGIGTWSVALGLNQPYLVGINCSWTVGNILTTANNFLPILNESAPHVMTYTFKKADVGLQPLSVNCSNMVSWMSNSWNVSVILDTVDLGSFTSDGPVYFNSTINFLLNVTRFGTGGCFEWNMADNSQNTIMQAGTCTGNVTKIGTYLQILPGTMLLNFTHVYTKVGAHNVSVRGFNHVNDGSKFLMVNVLDWTCFTPNVTLNNSQYLSMAQPHFQQWSVDFSFVLGSPIRLHEKPRHFT